MRILLVTCYTVCNIVDLVQVALVALLALLPGRTHCTVDGPWAQRNHKYPSRPGTNTIYNISFFISPPGPKAFSVIYNIFIYGLMVKVAAPLLPTRSKCATTSATSATCTIVPYAPMITALRPHIYGSSKGRGVLIPSHHRLQCYTRCVTSV